MACESRTIRCGLGLRRSSRTARNRQALRTTFSGLDDVRSCFDLYYLPISLTIWTDSANSLAFTSHTLKSSIWTLSPYSTSQRLILITSLLRVFLNYASTERLAAQAILHFASCLEDSVGADFESPDLGYLASFWLDKNGTSRSFSFPASMSRTQQV